MRISDWSSDVCSSDLEDRHREHREDVDQQRAIGAGTRRRLAIAGKPPAIELDQRPRDQHAEADDEEARPPAEQIGEDRATELPPDRSAIDPDRKSVVAGKRGSVRVDLGGCRIIKKKNKKVQNKSQKEK